MANRKIFWYIDLNGNITSALYPTSSKYMYLLAYLKASENPPHYDKKSRFVWWLKIGQIVIDQQTTTDYHEWQERVRAEWVTDNN